MFGIIPAWGFFIRHASGIELSDVHVGFLKEDRRPAFVLDDVKGADFHYVQAQKVPGVPAFVLSNVERLSIDHCAPTPDTRAEKIERKEM